MLGLITSLQLYLPADELGKISYITFRYLQLNSIVFYEVTEASHLQVQPLCYCMHHLLHSAELNQSLGYFYWHLTPILSSDFTTPFPSVYLTCAPPLFYSTLVL